jgi:hypothetical protein
MKVERGKVRGREVDRPGKFSIESYKNSWWRFSSGGMKFPSACRNEKANFQWKSDTCRISAFNLKTSPGNDFIYKFHKPDD